MFKLGSMSDDKFQQYREVVTKLGGALSYSQTRDPLITHLVTMNPSCSEVTLTCIVSGKWILMTTYLDDSLKAGYFLEVCGSAYCMFIAHTTYFIHSFIFFTIETNLGQKSMQCLWTQTCIFSRGPFK